MKILNLKKYLYNSLIPCKHINMYRSAVHFFLDRRFTNWYDILSEVTMANTRSEKFAIRISVSLD